MKTTILVEHETRELLREIGRKRQTYDDIINELAKKAGFDVKKLQVQVQETPITT